LLVLIVFSSQEAMGQFFSMGNPLIGKQAPDFTLETLRGKDVNMTEFRDGNSAIIFFWATWCPYCRKELDDFDKKIANMQKENIKLILVNVGEAPQKIRSFVDKNNINLDVFLDQDSSLSEKYGIVGIPTFFFVNESGVIKAVENALPEDYDDILLEK
ncbi:MAG TPA: TlpA family protein disulfide reductase, partial [Candidatus Marinimicrobia bacterium]|nr:TlpA family protein disulfide reductase [Candidatus Neomarinimicrobiota bacterium]